MRSLIAVVCAAAACGSLAAQKQYFLPKSFGPESTELGFFSSVPMMRPSARLQAFYGKAEVGVTRLIATGISFRYDGPIPKVGAAGPFTIKNVQVRIGTTTVGQPGAHFDSNLTQSLTKALDKKWSFLPDPGSKSPDVWGGPSGTLTFPFSTPVVLTVPDKGWLVVDLQLDGNNLRGQTHALLDAAKVAGGPVTGSAKSSGTGCGSTSSASATIQTSGTYAPGAAHSIGGSNLGAGAVVVTAIGASDKVGAFGALPVRLPGTSCSFYTSWDFLFVQIADSAGRIVPFATGSMLPIPAETRLNGAVLYEQLISIAPKANAHGLITSDMRTVTLGTLSPPAKPIYAVSNGKNARAAIADKVGAVGYALRIDAK